MTWTSYESDREKLLEPPLHETPPRCSACDRMVIWPDHKPYPVGHLCIECQHEGRKRALSRKILWFGVAFALAVVVFATAVLFKTWR